MPMLFYVQMTQRGQT